MFGLKRFAVNYEVHGLVQHFTNNQRSDDSCNHVGNLLKCWVDNKSVVSTDLEVSYHSRYCRSFLSPINALIKIMSYLVYELNIVVFRMMKFHKVRQKLQDRRYQKNVVFRREILPWRRRVGPGENVVENGVVDRTHLAPREYSQPRRQGNHQRRCQLYRSLSSTSQLPGGWKTFLSRENYLIVLQFVPFNQKS